MKFVQKTIIWTVASLLALAVSGMVLTSCGPSTSFVLRGRFYDSYDGRYYYNGDRRGDYVFYRGNWYLYGIGTPYEWGYNDPYIYW